MAGDDDDRHRTGFGFGIDSESSASLNTRIMIIAFISLSSVILLVLALHIYARCVLARRVNRRRAAAIRRLALAQYSQSQPGHAQSTEVAKPGLSPVVIAALPTFKFNNLVKDETNKSYDHQKMDCSVCLSLLEDEDMVRLLPNCKHIFHVECIDKWFEFNTSCPLCRAEAEPSAPPAETNIDLQDCENGVHQLPTALPKGGGTSSAVGSTSRLSSFRRMLSRDRSSRSIQPSAPVVELYVDTDVERQ